MIFFEDLQVGVTKTTGARRISEQEIIEFARQFDPQSFHLDPVAAERSLFGGLIASGFHTAAVMMSVTIHWSTRTASIPSCGRPSTSSRTSSKSAVAALLLP